MSEETVVAASSAEPAVMEVSRGPLVNLTAEQRAEFRNTGELPKPKTEEAAPSSEAKPAEGEAKPAGESEPPKVQEKKDKPKQTAEERIAQLEATIEKIRKGSEQKKSPEAESTPAPKPAVKPEYTRAKPTAEDKKADGTPKFDSYEDYIEDLADWKAEQREATSKRNAAMEAQAKATHAKVDEAKARYPDFADVVGPAVNAIVSDEAVSPVVKRMLDDSDHFADLVYTIGSKPEELASFLKMAKENPGKAIRYIALTESLIAEELEGKAKPAEVAPEKPRTAAPRPPAEVGGRSTAPPDDELTAVAANDYRAASAAFKRKALASFKT